MMPNFDSEQQILFLTVLGFEPTQVVTKLRFWDERSLYFEQRFVSLHDGFVRAIATCKGCVT